MARLPRQPKASASRPGRSQVPWCDQLWPLAGRRRRAHPKWGCHPLQNPSEAAQDTHGGSSGARESGDERWAREKGESGHQDRWKAAERGRSSKCIYLFGSQSVGSIGPILAISGDWPPPRMISLSGSGEIHPGRRDFYSATASLIIESRFQRKGLRRSEEKSKPLQ